MTSVVFESSNSFETQSLNSFGGPYWKCVSAGNNSKNDQLYQDYVSKIDQAHVWQGILYPGFLFKAKVLDDIRNVKIRPDDIFIATFPKSGTTWTAEIVSLIRSNVDLAYVGSKDISDRVIHLETPPNLDIKTLEQLKSPRIFGTHLPFHLLPRPIQQGKCKVIYVMRNPKDVAVSFYHHHRMAKDLGNFDGTFKQFLHLFSSGKTVCGSWFEHVLGYWQNKNRNNNILFLKYEEMKKNLTDNLRSVSDFLEIKLSESQIKTVEHHCSFEVMKKNEKANRDWIPFFDTTKGHFMRKGLVGDWKNHFDDEDNAKFMALYDEKIRKVCDLNLDFELRSSGNGLATSKVKHCYLPHIPQHPCSDNYANDISRLLNTNEDNSREKLIENGIFPKPAAFRKRRSTISQEAFATSKEALSSKSSILSINASRFVRRMPSSPTGTIDHAEPLSSIVSTSTTLKGKSSLKFSLNLEGSVINATNEVVVIDESVVFPAASTTHMPTLNVKC